MSTKHPSVEQMNREVAEKLGICWHELRRVDGELPHTQCTCGQPLSQADHSNPDFTTDAGKVQLLRLMMGRKDWETFAHLSKYFHLMRIDVFPDRTHREIFSMNLELLTDTPSEHRLLTAAWEWLCGKEKSHER